MAQHLCHETLATKTEIASNNVDCKTYLSCTREETHHRVVAASPTFKEKGDPSPSLPMVKTDPVTSAFERSRSLCLSLEEHFILVEAIS